MALSFLGSKSWHVGRNANIEAVHKAEKDAKTQERRAQQRRQELDAETHWLEMKLLEAPEEEKDKVKAEADLRFLYAPPPGLEVTEDNVEEPGTSSETSAPIETSLDKPKEKPKRDFISHGVPQVDIKPEYRKTSKKREKLEKSIKDMLQGLSTEEKQALLEKFEREKTNSLNARTGYRRSTREDSTIKRRG
ncbi:hypothetical protein GEMRC1_013587 [Eukaryota sp. GEM-RC1]